MQCITPSTPGRTVKTPQESTIKSKTTSLATRRAACTHLTMERLYGDYRCNVCLRPSTFGWVYLCTQDDVHPLTIALANKTLKDNISPPIDQDEITTPNKPTYDMSTNLDPDDHAPGFRMPTADLAPWMEKAISDGLYTSAQIRVLRVQKQHVVDVATAAIDQYGREAMSTDAASLLLSTPSKATVQLRNEDATTDIPLLPVHNLRMFPYCKFRACPACRLTFRDRAWQQFDDVFSIDAPAITASEKCDLYDTRNLASRKLMQTIGLASQSPPARAGRSLSRNRPGLIRDRRRRSPGLDRRFEPKYLRNMTENVRIANPASLESQDVVDAKPEVEPASKGLHQSLRRALKGVSDRGDGLRLIKRHNPEQESRMHSDLGSLKSLNDSLLKDAASVPLPEQDVTEGLIGEVGDLEKVALADGIAVKEESAELGSADII